jgi:uncharacterized protein (TIGR02996 family)
VSTGRDDLLRAILANPDDDALRLVYADWLEEHGEAEHARFIRSQVETARVPQWHPVWVRARYIDRLVGWPNGIPSGSVPYPRLPEGLEWLGGPYRRGFPSAVLCRGTETLLRHADEMFALAPVEELELGPVEIGGRLDLAPVVAAPWFARIRRLKVVLATLERGSITALQVSPYAANLTDLDVITCTFPDALADLFAPPLIARLRRLAVHVRDEGADLAGFVKGAGGPHRLRSLRLTAGRNHDRPRLLIGTGVFAVPLLRGLSELDLSHNLLGPDGIHELEASPIVEGLESLSLNWTRIGPGEIAALANSPRLARLQRLELANNGLPRTTATVLAGSPHLANLRVLNLEKNQLDDRAAAALAASRYLGGLIFLDLSFNQIGDRGAQALIDSPLADGLVFLRLVMNQLSGPMKRKLKRRFKERVCY